MCKISPAAGGGDVTFLPLFLLDATMSVKPECCTMSQVKHCSFPYSVLCALMFGCLKSEITRSGSEICHSILV